MIIIKKMWPGHGGHTLNPSTWQRQLDPGLHSEFQLNHGYIARSWLRNKAKKREIALTDLLTGQSDEGNSSVLLTRWSLCQLSQIKPTIKTNKQPPNKQSNQNSMCDTWWPLYSGLELSHSPETHLIQPLNIIPSSWSSSPGIQLIHSDLSLQCP